MVRYLLEPPLQVGDLAPDHPPVGLELGLARPAQSDTAADARQVGPHPREPREQVLELRQLDLHLRLGRARAGREDVEDHLGAIHHAHRECFLQARPLHRRERFVEQQQRRARLLKDALELVDLSLPEVERGGGGLDALVGSPHHLRAGRVGEPAELVEMVVHLGHVRRALARRADQERALDGRLDVDELSDLTRLLVACS